MTIFDTHTADNLIAGGVGVIPTDTLYGLVGRAENPETVERIYRIRKRSPEKPCIILISSIEDLKKFDIEISAETKTWLETQKIWPGKVSIVFPSSNPRFQYLARGTHSLAFRIPNFIELRNLLAQTGPLIAPSANIQGKPPSTTITSAREYFGDAVNFYVDNGILDSLPSTLITFENSQLIVLRQGAAF